jgi:hypothetical protein
LAGLSLLLLCGCERGVGVRLGVIIGIDPIAKAVLYPVLNPIVDAFHRIDTLDSFGLGLALTRLPECGRYSIVGGLVIIIGRHIFIVARHTFLVCLVAGTVPGSLGADGTRSGQKREKDQVTPIH